MKTLAKALRIEAAKHSRFMYPGKDLIIDSFNRLADAVDPPAKSKGDERR